MDNKTAEALRYVIDYLRSEEIPHKGHITPRVDIIETWLMHEADIEGDTE